MREGQRLAAFLTITLSLTTPFSSALAQDAMQETVVETVHVELVNVDVWITDESGAAVRGLQPEAFTLFHDGMPVPISHFAEITGGRPTSVPRASRDLESHSRTDESDSHRPHLVVLFDERHLSGNSLRRLAREVGDFLAGSRIPPERVLLLRLAGALSVEAPFGSGADELEHALGRIAASAGAGAGATSEVKQVVQALQSVWDELQSLTATRSLRSVAEEVGGATASQGASALPGSSAGAGAVGTFGGSSGRACDDYVDRVAPIVIQWAQREQTLTEESLRRLADVTSFLSGLPGMKILLYVSHGPETAPGVSATSFVRGLCPLFQTELEVDALPEEMDSQFVALTRRANANRVVVYAIQGASIEGSLFALGSRASADSRGIRSFERSRTASARRALTLLAEETGGRAVLGHTDLGAELDRIADEIGSYYSLAYAPPPSNGARDHQIDVVLADETRTARHRRGYRERTIDQWLTERLESALYLGLVDNPLEVRLGAAAAAPSGDNQYSLPLHVIVPAEQLTFAPSQAIPMSRLTLKVMALNTKDRALAVSSRTMFVPRPGEGAARTLNVSVPLELRPGLHVVAVAVLDTISRAASIVSTTIQVGPPETVS